MLSALLFHFPPIFVFSLVFYKRFVIIHLIVINALKLQKIYFLKMQNKANIFNAIQFNMSLTVNKAFV